MGRPKGTATKDKGKMREEGSKKKNSKSPTKERKKMRFHPGTVALREIKRYQKHHTPLTARAPFERRIRNTLKQLDPEFRLKSSTLE
mmetsp:Transcript_26445/g.30576  ORF Transcript_26445/g.30576 Transcript_26445/m.30576 type:complete len:87 (-) Transcript_26445:165-425(-)